MAKFHSLSVSRLERPTEESVALTFEVPFDLQNEFEFIQGQHVTLKINIDGKDVRRSYSICSCPLNKELTVAIKKLKGGKFSTYANDQLIVGERIEVMPPHGSFFVPLHPSNKSTYVAFASGSGITPIISIIETTLRTEQESEFILFYGNKKSSTIIFLEKLEALKNHFMGRFSLYHILSQEKQETDLFNGRIDAQKIQKLGSRFFDAASVDYYFTCGPEEMMLAVKKELTNLGVEENKIHLELFTSPVGKLASKNETNEAAKVEAEVTVILDGTSTTFPYDSEDSILDVAFENGLELPYACKGGVCSTCVARVDEGEVEMDINYALEPDELEKGLVLTCQARPKSDKVKLAFDI